jgi:hypothetical protein
MTPGETAFARIPRFAYSIARDFVAAFSPPFVSDASTEGTPSMAWSARLVTRRHHDVVFSEPWPLGVLICVQVALVDARVAARAACELYFNLQANRGVAIHRWLSRVQPVREQWAASSVTSHAM